MACNDAHFAHHSHTRSRTQFHSLGFCTVHVVVTHYSSQEGLGMLLSAGCFTYQQHANVSQRQICSDKYMCCHTDTEAANHTFISSSHNTQTPGQPVQALTLCQGPCRVAAGVPNLKSLVWLGMENSPGRKRESNLGLPLSRRTP